MIEPIRAAALGKTKNKNISSSQRERAISMLAMIGKLSTEPLGKLLEESDAGVRLQALYGLGYLGGQEAAALMLNVVESADGDDMQKAHAVGLLDNIWEIETAHGWRSGGPEPIRSSSVGFATDPSRRSTTHRSDIESSLHECR